MYFFERFDSNDYKMQAFRWRGITIGDAIENDNSILKQHV